MSRQRVFSDRQSLEIANAYQAGRSMSCIASEMGVSVPTIRSYLVRENIDIRPRGRYAVSTTPLTETPTAAPGEDMVTPMRLSDSDL